MEELLTVKDIARILKVNVWTVRAWVSQQRIPHIKVGRCVRFHPRAIEKWLESTSS